MTIRLSILFISFHLICFTAISQSNDFEINVSQQSLAEVLTQLHNQYEIHLSYNFSELSEYKVSLKGSFKSADELLKAIFNDLPFTFELLDDTYIIYKSQFETQQSLYSTILFTGEVKSKKTGEALPYSTVYINGAFKISDVNGRFTFLAFNEEFLKIEVSHVGYQHFDTTIIAQSNFTCQMEPVVNVLNETVVWGTKRRFGTQSGMSMGQARMNPSMADYLPGGVNNGVVQVMKLQAGVQMAPTGSGLQSVWGGYPGQNEVLFDGITIYSFPQSSELVCPVNTLMLKDVWINKGACGSNLGNRVGGIFMLTGKEGSRMNSEVNVAVDASLINTMVSVPVNSESSVVIGARHTVWPDYFMHFARESAYNTHKDVDVWNPYNIEYGDVNLKYSGGRSNGDQYYISLYGNTFQNAHSTNYDTPSLLTYQDKDKRHQLGASLMYNKIWKKGFHTTVSFVSSHAEIEHVLPYDLNTNNYQGSEYVDQSIWDNKFLIDSRFSLNSKQFIEAGLSLQNINTYVDVPVLGEVYSNDAHMLQTSAFIRNHIYATSIFFMDVGLRLDYQNYMDQLFICPRIKGSLLLGASSQINLSWGIHQQYLNKVPVIDALGNYDFIWEGFSQKGKYLQSNIIAAGWSFTRQKWNINTEIYSKSVDGVGRYIYDSSSYVYDVGRVRTNGVDVSIKKEFGNHLFIQNYTYNHTTEKYSNEEDYHYGIYTRDHELKTTFLMNFTPLKMSMSYIYGSPAHTQDYINILPGDYKQLDAMVSYLFHLKNSELETGFSAYNILDEANVSSLKLRKYVNDQTQSFWVGNGGIPFYITLFLHLKLKK